MSSVNQTRSYRVLIQGECDGNPDGWRGFYTARQVRALDEGAAIKQVLDHVRQDWAGPSAHLGTLTYAQAISCWPVGMLDWRKLPREGHTFYNDDADAQCEALGVEVLVAHAPRAVRRRLRDDLR